MVIPLIHHKNSGYTELKVLGVYFSHAFGGGKIHNQIGIYLTYDHHFGSAFGACEKRARSP